MKKLIIYTLVLSCAFLFNACGSNDSATVGETEDILIIEDEVESVEKVKSDVITETLTYSGKIANINIHMTLNYFEDNRIEGTYYYDKYKEDINILGEVTGENITLKSEDGSEEFQGTRSGDSILGQWKNGTRTLDFQVTVENEVIGKSVDTSEVTDGEYLYYTTGYYSEKSLYRCQLDGSNNEKLLETSTSNTIDIVDDKIYYINSEDKLSRMDKDGNNQEVIFEDEEILFGFIIYNGRIYFDNSSDRYSDEMFQFKMISVDLEGKGYKELILPVYYLSESDEEKSYYLSYIYKDKAYFTSLESGPESNIYRLGLDGSEVEDNYDGGEVVGAIDENFYSVGINQSVYHKKPLNGDNSESKVIFEGADTYRNDDSEDENEMINGDYFVYNYTMFSDDSHYITVMDLDGNILNEVEVPKMPKASEYECEYLRTVNIGEYIYIIVGNEVDNQGYIGRFKAIDGELEILTNIE